jgi:hypothetical protein
MSEYARHVEHKCTCGHLSSDHDDWPECDLCDCLSYNEKNEEAA